MVTLRWLIAQKETSGLDIESVFEAYRWISQISHIPSLFDVYNQYVIGMEAKRATWQAEYFPDRFYDGSPGSKPEQLPLPDCMQGENNPFAIMSPEEVETVLERFCMPYKRASRVFHYAVVGIW